MTAAARRKVVTWAQEAAGLSQRRACRFFGVARSTIQYRSVRPPNTEMRDRLRELAEERRRWGYRMLHVLLEREGHAVNHKRVYRLYREEGLQVRRGGAGSGPLGRGGRWRHRRRRVSAGAWTSCTTSWPAAAGFAA